jgi:hypothetical protein
MLNKNGVFGLLTIPRNLQRCEACILGKHNKQHFRDSTSRAHRKLELIHSDLCGPTYGPSALGNKYIMICIDGYTKMCWVFLLKHKSQSFETFKNFHVWIENETQSSINSLCTDNGMEYTCHEFETYLHQHGIKHHTIFPCTPRQNGVAKRMNTALLNMVHSMFFFKNVKLMFWADVVLCAMYVRNMIPSYVLGNKTPYEMWNDYIPSVWHLKVFFSTCYALIPKERRNKLAARSRNYIFLGYSNTTKAYHIYDEVTRSSLFPKM